MKGEEGRGTARLGSARLLLGQLLEALQQTPGRGALLGSQRRHEEVQVVEQGHVIVGVRLRHRQQLPPALPHAHA